MHLVKKNKFRDTQRKNAALSKTSTLTKSTNMGIWVTGTSNRLLN